MSGSDSSKEPSRVPRPGVQNPSGVPRPDTQNPSGVPRPDAQNSSRVPRDGDNDFSDAVVGARRELCESLTDSSFSKLWGNPVAPEEARGNIENFIGYAQVPVGLAGPMLLSDLSVSDSGANSEAVYVPMATNEGALVASHSRGMALANAGGGVRAKVFRDGLSQHPILVYQNAAEALAAAEFARAHQRELTEVVQAITSHGSLRQVETDILGRRLLLRLVFGTGDAIGINMASRGADLCSEWIAERTGAQHRFVHGQDVEKRANARALIEGRGRSVVAELTVPRKVLADRARVTPEQLLEIQNTYRLGFAQLGTQNQLIQAANGLAAVFLACGQDVAYVTESATGLLDFECTAEGDLYASAVLPSLLIGTVGGGSQKGTAAECLAVLGCAGSGQVQRFARILAATVLCGDLSLMASFCSHEFVAAHERLGRNRPKSS